MTRALWALKLRVQNAKKCNQLRRSQEEQTSGERSTSDRATVASLGSTGGREGNAAKHRLNSYLKKEVKAFSHECMNYEYIRLRFLSLCFLFCHVTSFICKMLSVGRPKTWPTSLIWTNYSRCELVMFQCCVPHASRWNGPRM